MFALALLILAADAGSPTTASEVAPSTSPVQWVLGLETDLGVWPSGFGENGLDLLVGLRPMAGFSVGDDFSLQVSPTFRLRVTDSAPVNRTSDLGGVLRRADWDELSDFGQILGRLSAGRGSSPVTLTAGPVRNKTLGLGHLVSRYSNQDNADYHPAGATGVLALGPIRAEVFGSDVLGARLFAADVGWDLGRTFSSTRDVHDRYVLALEFAHDFGLAGLPFRAESTAPVLALDAATLAHLDASAVVLRTQQVRLMLLAGAGARLGGPGGVGALGGAALDVALASVGVSVKVEARKQAQGFRQGYFGAGYELARSSDVGFSSVPRAQVSLPDAWSLAGEVRLGVGTSASVEVAAEHFFPGRTDVDALAEVLLFRSWLAVQARLTLTSLEATPRTFVSAAVRARVLPSMYVLASAGTAFSPQVDGTLQRGVSASLGLGVDFGR